MPVLDQICRKYCALDLGLVGCPLGWTTDDYSPVWVESKDHTTWYTYLPNICGQPPIKGSRGLCSETFSLGALITLWGKIQNTISAKNHPLRAYAKTSGVQLALEGISQRLLRNRERAVWYPGGQGWLLSEIKNGAGLPDAETLGRIDALWAHFVAEDAKKDGEVLNLWDILWKMRPGTPDSSESPEHDSYDDEELDDEELDDEELDDEENSYRPSPEGDDGALSGEELDAAVNKLIEDRG